MRRFATSIVLAFHGCSSVASTSLSSADTAAIRATQTAFVSAWLRDDTTGVLAALDDGVVLLPPGRRAVNGHAAVRDYWWPQDGSRTRITAFDWTYDEIGGSGPLAYARGTSTLSWTYDKDTLHQAMTARSQSLTLLRRSADGRWLITRQMWSPAPP